MIPRARHTPCYVKNTEPDRPAAGEPPHGSRVSKNSYREHEGPALVRVRIEEAGSEEFRVFDTRPKRPPAAASAYSPSRLIRWYARTARRAAPPGTHANSALWAATLIRNE